MNTWFESKLKYTKVTESGSEKRVTETFVLDAVSFTDAESRMISEAEKFCKGGEFQVKDIRESNLSEIFPYETGEWWYKVKVNLVTVDEEAGREKRMTVNYLVMADDVKEAIDRTNESLNYLVIPYAIISVAKSNVCDVFPYDLEAQTAEMQKK